MNNISTLLRLLSLKTKTAADILDPLVTDPACQEIMTIIMTSIFGLDYTEIDAVIFLFGSMGHYASGAFYPKGGSGKMSGAFAARNQEHRGIVRLETQVNEICISRQLCYGRENY